MRCWLTVLIFKFYFWSFVLRPVVTQCDPDMLVSWHGLEEKMVPPWSLEDVLFSNVSDKQTMLRFGPLVSNVIQTWHLVEKHYKISCRWHTRSPGVQ